MKARTFHDDFAFPSDDVTYQGLTKREYFAAMAMQGLVTKSLSYNTIQDFAKMSVKAANALITELNKGASDE